ncbi:MAG: DNA-binding domain-containing protein [Chromatiaceae bacterium]|nr:DNA-binding domain-containing protein [Chromatiaceae bacterium]
MPGLTELQAAFKRHLVIGDTSVAALVVGTDRVDGDQRLAVYARAYRARLIEALATDYAALKVLLGEEGFSNLCHGYIDIHPSTHYSLRWFGQHLPAYVRRIRDRDPHLAELAELEWTLAGAFDAADAPVIQISEVDKIPAEAWPSLRMRFHPSLNRLTFTWNVLDLWRTAKEEKPIPAPEQLPEPGDCLIWRDGLSTRYRSVEPDESAALDAAASGTAFAEICEGLIPWERAEQPVALRAASLLKTWLASGLVSELEY